MKKGYRVFTVFFVVAVLVMTGGSAMAAWTTTPAGISVIAGANTSLLFNATPQVNPIYSVSGAESMAVGDFVTLKLTGGAVFTGVSTADGLATPGGIATAGALTLMTGSGVAGSTEAKFRASVIIATPSAIRFNLAALINVTGVGVGSNVDFLLSITTSAGTAITTDASIKAATGGAYPFTGVNLMTITNTVNGAAVLDVLSVPAYSKFLNSSLVGGASVLTLTAPTGGFGAATLPNVGLSAKKMFDYLSW